MAQSRQKWSNLISQSLVCSFNINDFKRFKCGIKSLFFFLAKRKNNETTTREICYAFQMNFKIRNNKYPPKIMIGSKLTGVTISTLLSSRFSNQFYPSTTSWFERLRACAMNWAWKQWNSLSKSSITNSKHKPQARQKFFFF